MADAEDETTPPWSVHLAIGIMLIFQTFFDINWPGPWQASFTTGALGLLGIFLIYLAWFRYTFSRRGLLPTTNLWQNPPRSISLTTLFGITTLFLGWLFGNPLKEYFPAPTGMVLFLIGFLTLLVAVYAALVLMGPLKDGVVEEE